MILADTSIWIDHFRAEDQKLLDLLKREELLVHPFVIGEIALGNLRFRDQVLMDLGDLPAALVAEHTEVLMLLELHGLGGSGIGWVDSHLLCSTRLTQGCRIWTRDKRLLRIAQRLEIAF